ncbi:P-loop NTPase fold protein [Actinokineospora guangxiensis]|uniref:P-loop NTPase fold protein n=1 Tax=Actinokineospora guangxiensis TaxID=1490288 RepID=A0ABW0EU86_9PSEU
MKTKGDNPIKAADEDRLGRVDQAQQVAQALYGIDASEGSVVAILGPWGSGKTSLVNLVKERVRDSELVVLEFNPWMFSGSEQLVGSFLSEIAAQLRVKDPKLARFADQFDTYGDMLTVASVIPVVGPFLERLKNAGGVLKKLKERKKEGVGAYRARLAEALSQLEQPIVVVLDDIDRLTTQEIRDIFKLVRLTASFPNIIYLLAFDRARVEAALQDVNIDGRAYLEKIVQLTIDLPVIPESVVYREIMDALNDSLSGSGKEAEHDEVRLHDILPEIVRPLIKNMRDIRRYTAALRTSFGQLGGKIELVDLIALEAIRVFLPETFEAMVNARAALTSPAPPLGARYGRDDGQKDAIEALLKSADERGHKAVASALVSRVFLAGSRHLSGGMHYDSSFMETWRRDRRVAHPDVLALYLERIEGQGYVLFDLAEDVGSTVNDASGFSTRLRELPPDAVADVLDNLGDRHFTQLDANAAGDALAVVLNILPSLPERPRTSLYHRSAGLSVQGVAYRLLKRIHDTAAAEDEHGHVTRAIETAWTKIEWLSSKAILLYLAERESDGSGFLDGGQLSALHDRLNAEMLAADVSQLLGEPELIRLLVRVDGYAVQRELLDDAQFARAVLLGAVTESRSQSLGSRAIRKSKSLFWDSMIKIFGTEVSLLAAVTLVRELAENDPDVLAALELADKYAEGWRPRDFD